MRKMIAVQAIALLLVCGVASADLSAPLHTYDTQAAASADFQRFLWWDFSDSDPLVPIQWGSDNPYPYTVIPHGNSVLRGKFTDTFVEGDPEWSVELDGYFFGQWSIVENEVLVIPRASVECDHIWLFLDNRDSLTPWKDFYFEVTLLGNVSLEEVRYQLHPAPDAEYPDGQFATSGTLEVIESGNGLTRIAGDLRIEPNPPWETLELWFPLLPDYSEDAVMMTNLYVATNCVPEPATLTLFGLGLAGIATRRFMKRRRS